MTVQDEARELMRVKSAAEDELAAIRRDMNETVKANRGRVDRRTAEHLTRRLNAATERKHQAEKALQALNEETSCS